MGPVGLRLHVGDTYQQLGRPTFDPPTTQSWLLRYDTSQFGLMSWLSGCLFMGMGHWHEVYSELFTLSSGISRPPPPHYQSFAMARTNWKIFYKSPIPDFTDEFQMVLWSHVKIAENHCTFFCPFPKTILKPRGSKWVLRAFSAEAVTGGIEEALNQLFHLTDHITWMIPFFPSCFLNNTWVEKG